MTSPDSVYQSTTKTTSGGGRWPNDTARAGVVGVRSAVDPPVHSALVLSTDKDVHSKTTAYQALAATIFKMPPLNSTAIAMSMSNSTLWTNDSGSDFTTFPTPNATEPAGSSDSGHNVTFSTADQPIGTSHSITTLFPEPGMQRTDGDGLTSMEIWFLVTGCIIALVAVLLALNCFIQYKEKVAKQVKKMQPDGRRVTGEAGRSAHEEEKNVQTHIFYHPFFQRGGHEHSTHGGRL